MDNRFNPMDSLRAAGNRIKESDLVKVMSNYGGSAVDYMMQPAHRASKASQAMYPGQDWDNSQRNALRHSMWIGGMAQAMGAGPDNPIRTPLAQVAAKGLGVAHEGISNAYDWWEGKAPTPAQSRDTRHDLNNNAIGAEMAGYTKDNDGLLRALSAMSANGRAGAPVGMLAMSDGRLSYDQRGQPPTMPVQLSRR